MSLLKKFATVATMVAPLALAACMQPGLPLCPKEGEGIGQSSYSMVFNGAAQMQKVCKINGSDLKDNMYYNYDDGLLVIKGDVPGNTAVKVTNGKLLVDGNVGPGAKVASYVPELTHTYTTFVPIYTGKTFVIVPMIHTVFDGFRYQQDNDPAMIIKGSVDQDARVSSNHGIHIGKNFSADAKFYHKRDGQQITTGQPHNLFIAPLMGG
jgi:hypothetical protein